MSSRRRAREYALSALVASDLGNVSVRGVLSELWTTLVEDDGLGEARPADSDEVEFAQRLAWGADARKEEIDGLLEGVSAHWRVVRMPVVDRNVLRIATFELLACPDIPGSVTINEAIELAKRFGGADSGAFVNGIVDRMARQLGRVDGAKSRHGAEEE